MNAMSDNEVWGLVEEWIKSHKGAIYGANSKYGWMHGADSDDTCQDLRLYCFRTIRSLERDAIKTGNVLDWEDKTLKKTLTNRTIGLYHANAWNNRTIENLRQSDFYAIERGSDADCGIKSASIDDIEAWGQFAPVEYNHFDDNEPDAASYSESRELTERILDQIISILPVAGLVKETNIGGRNGVLTHQEAAMKIDKTRSAVTKALTVSKKELINFCRSNNLSLDTPPDVLLDRIKELTACYKASKRGRNGYARFIISDFLDAEIDELKPKTRKRTRVTGRNTEKRLVEKKDVSIDSTVEDYIALLGMI